MSTKVEMMPKYLWLMFLVGLFVTPILSQDCVKLTEDIEKNMNLISGTINSFPAECLREIKAFELPKELLSYNQPLEDIKEAFHEMASQSLYIINQYIIKSTRGKKYLGKIKQGLLKQMEHLNHCLKVEEKENEVASEVKEDKTEHSGAKVFQWSYLELTSYFKRMDRFVNKKKYSHCAWVIVGTGIRHCFSYYLEFTQLLEREKNHLSSSKN